MNTDDPKHRPLFQGEQEEPDHYDTGMATFSVIMGAIAAIIVIVIFAAWYFLYNTTQN